MTADDRLLRATALIGARLTDELLDSLTAPHYTGYSDIREALSNGTMRESIASALAPVLLEGRAWEPIECPQCGAKITERVE